MSDNSLCERLCKQLSGINETVDKLLILIVPLSLKSVVLISAVWVIIGFVFALLYIVFRILGY